MCDSKWSPRESESDDVVGSVHDDSCLSSGNGRCEWDPSHETLVSGSTAQDILDFADNTQNLCHKNRSPVASICYVSSLLVSYNAVTEATATVPETCADGRRAVDVLAR